jgi:hypothetical protein
MLLEEEDKNYLAWNILAVLSFYFFRSLSICLRFEKKERIRLRDKERQRVWFLFKYVFHL